MLKIILIAIVVYLAISLILVFGFTRIRKTLIESVKEESFIGKIGFFIFYIAITPIVFVVSITKVAIEARKLN